MRVREEAGPMVDAAALGVGGAEIEPAMRANEIAEAHIGQGSSVT